MGKVGNFGVTGSSLMCLLAVVGVVRCMLVDAGFGGISAADTGKVESSGVMGSSFMCFSLFVGVGGS